MPAINNRYDYTFITYVYVYEWIFFSLQNVQKGPPHGKDCNRFQIPVIKNRGQWLHLIPEWEEDSYFMCSLPVDF